MLSSFSDEKDIVLITIIVSIFIATTLNIEIGLLYVAMAFTYAVALNQSTNNVYQVEKGKWNFAKIIAISGVAIAAWFYGSQFVQSIARLPITNDAFSVLASSFTLSFKIDNPLIKQVVWGVFIPLVETLFFLGVIQKYVSRKTRAKDRLHDPATWVTIAIVAATVTLFHIVAHALNDSALLTDFVFFGISAALVVIEKGELKVPLAIHTIVNSYVMARINGFVH